MGFCSMILASWLRYFEDNSSISLTVNSSSFSLAVRSNCEIATQYFLCSLKYLIWRSLEQYFPDLHLKHLYRVVPLFLQTQHFSDEGLLEWVTWCLSWATSTRFFLFFFFGFRLRWGQTDFAWPKELHTKKCEQFDLGTV